MSANEMHGVETWRCTCGARYFPERLLCVRCGGHEFTTDRAHEAVVEEVTVVRHLLGQTDWKPRRIASVRTPEGLLMTVGLNDESGPGDVIALYQDGTAPFGRAKG